MTEKQRQSAVDTVKERLDALLALAECKDGYPFNRYLAELPEAIVGAVIAQIWPLKVRTPEELVARVTRVQRAKDRMDRDRIVERVQ